MKQRTRIFAHPLFGPTLLLLLLTFVSIMSRPLTPIDETRYVSVAWEMWQRNEYLVLYKNGDPYSHKPPLLFWLYNLGWVFTGVNEWWPRLISPLFSFGGLWLTLSISRRLWPDNRALARQALWVLASSMLWMLFSTSAMFDVMLAFFVLLGIHGLLIAAAGDRRRGFIWFGLAIGLGVLAKGPVILLHLLPVALLAPWWKRDLALKPWYVGILLGVLGGAGIALAWAIPAAIHGGEEYRRMIFWGQTANRMVDSFAHKRAIWWYLPLLPLLLFPWITWPRLWRGLLAPTRQGLDSGLRLCLAWLVPTFIFFSLLSGKQIHYLVPLVPAFALLVAHLSREASTKAGGIWLPGMLVVAAGSAMLYLSQASVLPGMLKNWSPVPVWPGAFLLVVGLAALGLGHRPGRQTPALVVMGATLYVSSLALVSGNLWQRFDIHPIATEIRKLQDKGVAVANSGIYHDQFHFAGRLDKTIDELAGPAEIGPWFARNPEGGVVVYTAGVAADGTLFSQPYIGNHASLLDARQARALGLAK
jgi:4-amino-4-deoxy-L-arabinose transferase-like glycosyltransferase